ncbi:MAG: PQQ-binding-like beta-propeller repeat protein [Acidobacteriota bacterium]
MPHATSLHSTSPRLTLSVRLRDARLALASLLTAGLLATSLGTAVPAHATGTDTESSRRGEAWLQWGGPNKDFRATSGTLAGGWPESGPPVLWERDLGAGYSTIVAEDGRLYTMYRSDDDTAEVIVALSAANGATLWEHRIETSPADGHVDQFGRGPRSTPLLVGDRLFTVGISGVFTALDKTTGKVLWSRDLWNEFDATFLNHGYSSSPVAYGDDLLVLVGGEDSTLVALDQAKGTIEWKSLGFANSYATPQLLEVDGELQLITFVAEGLIGVDPDDGRLLWQVEHSNQWGQNINPPALLDGEYLLLSSPQAGAKGLRLGHDESGATTVEQIWDTRRIQFYHVTTVRDGEWVYGSTGTGSPAFMAAVNVKTGEVPWRKRGFAKANVVWADGKLFVLDENGVLSMTHASPEDLEVIAQAEVLERPAWSAPTIVGQTMYVRDSRVIKALDLSPEGVAAAKKAPRRIASAEPGAEESAESAESGESAESSESAPSYPPASETRDARAIELMAKTDAATRAVRSARYTVTLRPEGVATNFVQPAEGTLVIEGWVGQRPERIHAEIQANLPGADKPVRLTAGTDGEIFYVIDHTQKKAWSDLDPNVVGSYGGAINNLVVAELVHSAPFSDELNAETLKHLGDSTVAGEPVHLLDVAYTGGRGHSTWAMSTKDHLPRQRIRHITDPEGEEGKLIITITALEADPKLESGTFAMVVPEGYERVDDFAP